MAAQEKTEAATEKKRKDERKKGNVFQSNDIITAFSTLAIFTVLKFTMPMIYEHISTNFKTLFAEIGTIDTLSVNYVYNVFKTIFLAIVVIAGPIMLTSIAVGVIFSGAQTKFIFSREQLKIKFSHISPIQGFKKIFSARTFVELLKSIVKAIIIGWVLFGELRKFISSSSSLIRMDVLPAIGNIFNMVLSIVYKLSIVFIAIGVADYAYQWWDHERNIRMTKQEVKEEYKEIEGNPEIKGKIKDMQRKRATMRMMQQVPKADVVVRNPTHVAIALKYDIDKNTAPVVVAKGLDNVAFRIIAEAEKYDIPTIENKPLARALYKDVELGQEIPGEYYSAIAEILAWVYSLKKKVVKQN